MSTRRLLESSWNAGRCRATLHGGLAVNAATKAGELMAMADGNAQRARATLLLALPPDLRGMTTDAKSYWVRVISYLTAVEIEEQSARGPLLSNTGTGE